MHKKLLFFLGIVFLVGLIIVATSRLSYAEQAQMSPYTTQLDSSIRGLSSQEIDDLLMGRGAGYARIAELNNYPGPRHVLDLQQQLNLSSEQIPPIEQAFKKMQAQAKQKGEEIVEREKQLSTAFASGKINEAEMRSQVEELGKLYGQLRATHLMAHLQIKPLLTSEQINNYNKLRGYSSLFEQSQPNHQQHGN